MSASNMLLLGVGGGSSTPTPPLDNLDGATVAAAYGLQLLRTAYSGPLIKIRRSSDSTTQDINATSSGALDTDAITTFVGSNSAFIDTWYDQSGNARHLTASVTGRQPRIVNAGTLDTIGTSPAMVADGTDDCLFSASFDLSAFTQAHMVTLATHVAGSATTMAIAELGTNILSANGGFGIFLNNGVTQGIGPGIGNSSRYLFTQAYDPSQSIVYSCTVNSAGASNTARMTHRVLGEDLSWQNTGSSGTIASGDGFAASKVLYLFARANASLRCNSKCAGFVLLAGAAGSTLISNIEQAFATAAGLTLGSAASGMDFSNTPTDFDYAHYNTTETDFVRTNVFSEVSFSTTATLIKLQLYNDIFGSFTPDVAVWVDDVFNQQINPPGTGLTTHYIGLSSGTKNIRVTNGLQAKPSSAVLGCWLKTLTANASLTRNTVTDTGGMVIYGDSIASGYIASPNSRYGWAMRHREAASYPVSVEAYGSRALNDDTSSAPLQADLVSRLASLAPTKVWLAIGTNDYGLNRISAATFETRYASLLVDINAALPGATIYAQTPIDRATETANTFGDTLGAYRTAISNAASGKGYVTVVDGTAILALGDLSDGVHPSTAGMATYATYVAGVAGV